MDYRAAIERAADEVNERFARPDWTPVWLVVRDDFLASIAAYLEYDVLLVNPVMDGLNLVAKEAPLVNDRDGVLVLSREAGAFEELAEWVVPVDPLDVEGQAAALERAIGVPAAERRAWLEGIRRQRPDARHGRMGRPRAPRARRARSTRRRRGYDATVSAGPDVASRELVSIDPATLEPLGRVPVTPPEELAEVVAEARMAQAAFAREPLARPAPAAGTRRPRARRGRRLHRR